MVEFSPEELELLKTKVGSVTAADEPIVSDAQKRGLTRAQAIAYGRRLAEDECRKLRARRPDIYNDENCRDRIKRAEEYAAWEYDGRLAGTIGRRA